MIKTKDEITINWHIIEQCNYRCKYCFAKYSKVDMEEIHKSKENIEIVLNKIYSFFNTKYKNHNMRLNIAGGEPTLSRNINFIIKKAYDVGFNVSIITNASKLTSKFIELNAQYISMFAISIDSFNKQTNLKIARASKNETIKLSQVIKYIETLRYIHKSIKIKINTVVSEFNYSEYLGDFINIISPYKWKVFQALPFNGKSYCDDEFFKTFLNNHKNMNYVIFKESNKDMINSYIMIDPYGRFYQNTFSTYKYSNSILNTDIKTAFSSIEFDVDKFKNRYIPKDIK